MPRDTSTEVLKVLQAAGGPLAASEIAGWVIGESDIEAVEDALLSWQRRGAATQGPDGRWAVSDLRSQAA